ncbi:Transmembrane protein [Stenotrophomonas pavanii]|uniref:hypothetical protein n=1 Tax=Stenotrophomonas TaxID=40323 RepID=UPI00070CF6EF|nr:hypothetical protein [Stenotrophomonas pavanii]KRG76995.1 hypothetical protein ABB31_16615 [Stenotrophomonas pavanii]MBH1366941.1 hypothetical protein [Stenotrophomonas maltophilia]MBH1434756.1 hypothetical protein [Stenotrophomonas maltophilia]MBH1529378.1 hypothetical protein [Stenotrophomonas maltophilia]
MDTRIKLRLSQEAIAFLFFFGFLLGVAITSAALLGSQIPLKCFEAGNLADWVAALGTWVIGVAATFVAVVTFLYTRAQGRGVRSALLKSARFITADALWIEIEISAFLDRPEERQKWRHLKKMLKECHVRSEPIKIDSAALPYVPDEANKTLAFINTRLRGLRTLMESDAWKEPEGKGDEFIGKDLLEALGGIHSFAKEIDEYCEDFSNLLRKAAATKG